MLGQPDFLRFELRRERRVVGDLRPWPAGVNRRALDGETTQIYAIEAQHRFFGGETAAGRTGAAGDRLVKTEAVSEQCVCLVAPVVEIAGDDERRIRIGNAFQVTG